MEPGLRPRVTPWARSSLHGVGALWTRPSARSATRSTRTGERGFQLFVRTLTQSARRHARAGRDRAGGVLFRYITWLDEHFDCSAIRVLPDLHRQTTIEEVGLPDALDAIHASYLRSSNFGSGVFSEEAIRDALAEVQRSLQSRRSARCRKATTTLAASVMGVLVGPLARGYHQGPVHRLTRPSSRPVERAPLARVCLLVRADPDLMDAAPVQESSSEAAECSSRLCEAASRSGGRWTRRLGGRLSRSALKLDVERILQDASPSTLTSITASTPGTSTSTAHVSARPRRGRIALLPRSARTAGARPPPCHP